MTDITRTTRNVKRGGECIAPTCEKLNNDGARGFCNAHYLSFRAGVDLGVEPTPMGAGCDFPDCANPHHANGYCTSHNGQLRRGKPLKPLRAYKSRAMGCTGPGMNDVPCGREVQAAGLCSGHYWQRDNKGELTPIREYQPKGGPCAATECLRSAEVEGMCQTHRRYFLSDSLNWDRPIPEKAANGSGHTDKNGYRHLTVNGKRKSEHVHFAEQILGRSLLPGENIHHKNGNRSDNRTNGPFVMDERGRLLSGNLEVWSQAQPAGQEIGPKFDWSVEMIDAYAALVDDERFAALESAIHRAKRARVVLEGMVE